MTYAELTGAVLALSGGLEPGPDPVSTWGNADKTDPVPRPFQSHGAAAAFAAALTRTLHDVARRLPEIGTYYIMPPVALAYLTGQRRFDAAVTWEMPAVRGLSCRCRGRGTVTIGEASIHVSRATFAPLRLVGGAGTVTFTPDAGGTLTVADLTLFSDPGTDAAGLPLACGDNMLYDLSAVCPRHALTLRLSKPARMMADALILPRDYRLPAVLTAALLPPTVRADDVLQNGGGGKVPVPEAAAPLVALGVAADLYAAEPDLPASLWRQRFDAGLSALPRPAVEERIFDREGWL